MKPTILLDKSFLQATNAIQMREMADSHRLLMSDALFYELLSNPRDRKRCFEKFPRRENPVDLVMHVGGHLRKEIQTRSASGKPSNNLELVRFNFSEKLLEDDYELPDEALEKTAEYFGVLQSDVVSFVRRALGMKKFFPDVFVGPDKNRWRALRSAEQQIVNNRRALLKFYAQLRAPIRQPGLPRKRHLTIEWALYRWVQIQLLFALDLARRYGDNLRRPFTAKQYEKIEHDVLDAQYLILGVLEGSFGTNETKLKDWFLSLCPEGALYTNNGDSIQRVDRGQRSASTPHQAQASPKANVE